MLTFECQVFEGMEIEFSVKRITTFILFCLAIVVSLELGQ